MPDAAGSWPEDGTRYLPGAPMEPVQQPYQPQPQPQYQQQPYPQQGYEQQQFAAQQQYGAPQQQYPAQPVYPDQTVPQQAVFAEEEQAAVPSEFDHLFRDSSPVDRRSISAGGPVVSGPGAAPGFQQAPGPVQQAQAAQATAVYNPAQAPQGFDDRGPHEYAQDRQFDGGYGAPGESGGFGGGSRRTPLMIGGAVAVVAAIGLYFGLSGGGSSSGGTPVANASTQATQASTETAQQQAAAVYALVQMSKQLRADIINEVAELKGCENVSGLQAAISATAAARQAQADRVSQLDVSKISNGSELASDLNAAWSASATSDADFAKTAGDVASGCSASAWGNDPSYSAGAQASSEASVDKVRATSLWNQTMQDYGQPRITEKDL